MSSNRDNHMPDALHDRLQAEAPDDRAALDALWRRLGDVDPTPGDAPDLADEWDALQDRRPEISKPVPDPSSLPQNGEASTASSRRKRASSRPPRTQRWARGLGTLALILVVAVGTLWVWRQPVSVTAPPGQQRTATLPDGSTVELNSGTTLTYRRGFQSWPLVSADRRAVQLRGEAFFSVEDGTRPFIVETNTATVTVEGTRFNVRARTALDSATTVTLSEGRVRAAPQSQPANAVVLDQGGETSRVQFARASSPEVVNLKYVLAWRSNGFAVTNEPLSRVLHELGQRYNASIQLHDSVTRPLPGVTLHYPEPKPLPTILRDLCTALDLNFRPTSEGYEIFSGP